MKSYNELMSFDTFEERFKYLKMGGVVGADTFGFDRYLNQDFYKSKEWKDLRNYVILRDNGCDLAIPELFIFDKVIIHHINPLSPNDIVHSTDLLLDPNNLICTSMTTHNAIHYGELPRTTIVERKPNDTCPWRH